MIICKLYYTINICHIVTYLADAEYLTRIGFPSAGTFLHTQLVCLSRKLSLNCRNISQLMSLFFQFSSLGWDDKLGDVVVSTVRSLSSQTVRCSSRQACSSHRDVRTLVRWFTFPQVPPWMVHLRFNLKVPPWMVDLARLHWALPRSETAPPSCQQPHKLSPSSSFAFSSSSFCGGSSSTEQVGGCSSFTSPSLQTLSPSAHTLNSSPAPCSRITWTRIEQLV